MNKAVFYLFLIVPFFSCQSPQTEQVQEDAEIISTVNQILDDWHKAAVKADYQEYMSAMDSTSIFIGTDITENWTKPEFEAFSKPIFDRGRAWNFDVLDRNTYLSDSKEVVWFDEILNTWMGVCIGSGVLQRDGKDWKIEQYVLSVAVPNENIETVIAAKKKSDSLYLLGYNVRPK